MTKDVMAVALEERVSCAANAAAGASDEDVHGARLPFRARRGKKSGHHAVDEGLGGRLEVGDLLAEAAEALLHLVDVLGYVLGIGADGGNGRAHRVGGE